MEATTYGYVMCLPVLRIWLDGAVMVGVDNVNRCFLIKSYSFDQNAIPFKEGFSSLPGESQ